MRAGNFSQRMRTGQERGSVPRPASSSKYTLTAASLFQFLRRARPVFAQQSAERTVGHQLSSGLAVRTVFGLIRRVPTPLAFFSTHLAGLTVSSMDIHFFAESGHVLRKFVA